MKRPFRLWTISSRAKTGTTSMSLSTGVMRDRREEFRIAAIESNRPFLGTPFVIFSTTEDTIIEGDVIPIFTRDLTARSGENYRIKVRLGWYVRSSEANELHFTPPGPIFDAMTSITPEQGVDIPFFTYFDLAKEGANYRAEARRKAALIQAGQVTAPPIFPAIIPATVFPITTCNILGEIQAHMLEPTIDDGITWASGLWTAEEVQGFLQERLSRFLVETGLVQNLATISVAAGSTSDDYPGDTIDVRRAVWRTQAGERSDLERLDKEQADNGIPGWEATTATVPTGLIEFPGPSLSFTLVPPPSVAGFVEILYIKQPSTVTSACTPLPIPDMFAPFIKWGVIADMLMKEGEANDPQRAEVAEGRFQLGIGLAKLMMGEHA